MFFDIYSQLCAQKGVSLSKAAEENGLSRTSVVKWKNGSTPSGATIQKLAAYFDVSVDYLLGNTDKKEKAPAEEGGGITDEELKFALFDAPEEITDDIMDEVKRFAKYVEEQRRNGHIK